MEGNNGIEALILKFPPRLKTELSCSGNSKN